jgi:hypothetical protein
METTPEDKNRQVIKFALESGYDVYRSMQKSEVVELEELYAKKRITGYEYSGYSRLVNISLLKHKFTFPKTNIVSACFKFGKITDSVLESCNFGFIHGHYDGVFTPLSISGSPSLMSQDGEYRGRVITFDLFTLLYEKHRKPLQFIEKMVADKVENGELLLDFDIYDSTIDGVTESVKSLSEYIENNRVMIKLYVVTWLGDFVNITEQIEENHMNPTYKSIIYDPDDKKYLDQMKKNVSETRIKDILKEFREYNVNGNSTIYKQPKIGQKFTPLTAGDIKRPDCNSSAWREVLFASCASNLVANIICPCLPVLLSWFYVKGGPTIYDNVTMHALYNESVHAEKWKLKITEAAKYEVGRGDGDSDSVDGESGDIADSHDSADSDKSPIKSKNFKRVEAIMNSAEVQIDENLRYVDRSICVMSEALGRTVKDILMLLQSPSCIDVAPELCAIFKDITLFKRHMFDYAYALYSLHSRCGIIHSDLHLNNVTLFQNFQVYDEKGGSRIKDPKILYRLDKNYIFKHVGIFSAVIDFSRGLYCHHYNDGNCSSLPDDFYEKQVNRVLFLLHSNFPEYFAKHRLKITARLLTEWNDCFKLISAIDAYMLFKNLNARFQSDPTLKDPKFNITIPEVFPFLEECAAKAKVIMDTALDQLVAASVDSADTATTADTAATTWPMLDFITEVFSEFVVPDDKIVDHNVVDMYNYNFKQEVDLGDYSTWNDIYRQEQIYKYYEKLFGHKVDGEERDLRYMRNRDERAQLQEVEDQIEVTEPIVYPEWMFR